MTALWPKQQLFCNCCSAIHLVGCKIRIAKQRLFCNPKNPLHSCAHWKWLNVAARQHWRWVLHLRYDLGALMKCVYRLLIYHAPKDWHSIRIQRCCSRPWMRWRRRMDHYSKPPCTASLNRWPSCTSGSRDIVACARDRACTRTSARGAAVSALWCLLQRHEFVDCHSRAPDCLQELISITCWAHIHEESCTHIHAHHVPRTQFQSRKLKYFSSCAVQWSHFQKLCEWVAQYCWMCPSVGLTVPWVVDFLSSRFPL